jgi:hypothetical protein
LAQGAMFVLDLGSGVLNEGHDRRFYAYNRQIAGDFLLILLFF